MASDGINSLPLSTINLNRFKQRLRDHFLELTRLEVEVSAFEIGNEVDWVYFNGDIDITKTSSLQDFDLIAQSYGLMIKAAVEEIRKSDAYPDAKILTGGFANIPTSFVTAGIIENPERIFSAMLSLNQVNYLSDVNAYATHLYAELSDLSWLSERLESLSAAALAQPRPI